MPDLTFIGESNSPLESNLDKNNYTKISIFLSIYNRTPNKAKSNKEYIKNFTFYIIPQLNPDGAKLYTRNNFNDVDLNRDAIKLSQPESKCLINS